MQIYQNLAEKLEVIPYAHTVLGLLALVALAALANWLVRSVLLRVVRRIVAASPMQWDDALLAHGGFAQLVHVVPALVILAGIDAIPGLPEEAVSIISRLAQAYMAFTVALAARKLLTGVGDVYAADASRVQARPIKGYLQVAKIVVFVAAAIWIFATLAGASILHVLTGLGAMTAVTMLIFQDTILSFVASMQIGSDGRVRVGDWIEMPSENADGDVIDIALYTITVQNWDKTVTSIPTKKLISESFRNWRGMNEAGGRRIKRSLCIDQKSVHFLVPGEVERLRRFDLLEGYIEEKRRELGEWNARIEARGADAVNTRRVTNLGTFRAYVVRYLQHHPGIHQGLTLLVRQLQPGEAGIPLEIYCFTSNTGWQAYERVQSDIFDHLLAILPEFGLQVFQARSDAPLDVNLRQVGQADAGDRPGDPQG